MSNERLVDMAKALWTKASIGCHADGALGHDHVRSVLATMVERVEERTDWEDSEGLAESLRGPMPDDADDEYEALNLINDHTAPGLYFDFADGDLLLLEMGYSRD